MTALLYTALLIFSAFAEGSACREGTLRLVSGTGCRRYAECKSGAWYLKECKLGHLFNSNTLRCETVTSVERLIKCKNSTKCEEGRTFLYQGNTSLFYKCLNSRISLRICGTGEVFDYKAEECRPRADQNLISTSFNRTKRDAKGACKEGSRYRDGKSCKKYVECINGQEVKKTCSQCMNYDDGNSGCRFVFISPCSDSPPTTEPAPETSPPVTPPQPSPETSPPVTPPQPSPETSPPVTPPQPSPETSPPVTPPQPSPETSPPVTPPQPSPETSPPVTPPQPAPETSPPVTPPQPSPETSPPVTPPQPSPETSPPVTPPQPSTLPTPCVEGERIGLPDPDCKTYQECRKGVWEKDSCHWYQKFDADRKECLVKFWHFSITCAK